MKEVESLSLQYVGFAKPSSEIEVELEILGLRTAIAAAEQRIAVLTQSLKLQEIKLQKETHEETVTEASKSEEIK